MALTRTVNVGQGVTNIAGARNKLFLVCKREKKKNESNKTMIVPAFLGLTTDTMVVIALFCPKIMLSFFFF
jgi:hypothetical protein